MNWLRFGPLVLTASLATRSALGEAGRGPTRAPHVVEIHVDGKPAHVSQTRVVATEILLRIAVVPVVLAEDTTAPSYPTPGEPFVRAYFDFRSPGPRLVIVDGNTQRELERRTLPADASLETSVEAASHVLYMVVDSLLEEAPAKEALPQPTSNASQPSASQPSGSQLSASQPSASQPTALQPRTPQPRAPLSVATTPPVEAPRAARTRAGAFGLEAGAAFRSLYLGASRLQPGGGLALDLRQDASSPRFSVVTLLSAYSPVELGVDAARVTLLPWSVVLSPSFQSELAPRLDGLVGVSASLTWFSLSAEQRPGVRPASSAGGADVALGAVVGVRVRTSNRLALSLSGALDLDLAPRTFVADVGGERRVLAALPRLRPLLTLTATYSLLGSNGVSGSAEVD